MTYQPAPPNVRLSPSSLSHVLGEPNETAAYDAYLTVNGLLSYRGEHQGDRILFCPLDLKKESFEKYTVAHLAALVQGHAKEFLTVQGLVARQAGEEGKVVGMIGWSLVDYWVNKMAISRLGHIPFPLALGLAPSTAVTLLQRANASMLLVGPGGEEYAETIAKHGDSLPRLAWCDHTHQSELFGMKSFIDDGHYRTTISAQDLAPEIALIAHTSGSTNIPKLVPIRNVCITQVQGIREDGVRDMLFLGAPQQGAHTYVPITCLAKGDRCYVYNQTAPMEILTIISAMRAATMGGTNKVNTFLTFPGMHQAFKTSDFAEEAIELLRSFDGIVSGGSAPTSEGQQWLEHAGIKICNYLGSTEAGTILDSGHFRTSNWDWVEEHPTTSTWIRFEPYDDLTGASELIILPGYPTLNVCNRADGSYATDDLFLPHPGTKGKWKHWMRKGDVMVHSTGMKTDPNYTEGRLMASPLVKQALVVGTGFSSPGVLIIPTSDTVKVNDLAPLVHDINQSVPEWSRLRMPNVRLLSPETVFDLSSKGMAKRKATEEKFRDVIESIYVAPGR